MTNPAPSPGGGVATSSGAPVGAATPGALAPLDAGARAWVDATLASLSLRDKVGQLMMPWVGGEYAAIGSPEFEQVRRWVEEDRVGGLVFSVGSPLAYAVKTNELQNRARVPLLITSDMENGTGMRMGNMYHLPTLLPQGGGTVFPPTMALGATGSEDLAFSLGRILGREARAVGVHMTFGPVLDVNSNPLNPIINTRSYGEDPALVSRLARAYIRGTRESGLMSTGKHFPGHGDTRTDSHIELPTIPADRTRLDAVELPPFRAAVDEGVDAIMTAHIAVVGVEGPDAPPATLSGQFMTSVLRDDLGFSGLLFTDAMTMGAVARRYGATEPLVLAVEAGADVLLMPRDVREAIETVMAALEAGRLTEARIDQSVRRILESKARAGLHRGRTVDVNAVTRIVNVPEHAAVAREMAERSIVLARDTRESVPLPASVRQVLSVTYADQADLPAGRTFDQQLRRAGFEVISVRVDDRTTAAEYQQVQERVNAADAVVASAYVYPRDYRGNVATAGGFTEFVQRLSALTKPVVIVSLGSPYLLNAFPAAPAYLLGWGGAPVSQTAAARALAGFTPISGKLPVSLPPHHALGEGLERAATRVEK
ncbi:MAG TPA: glycoside hydrolase family 3 N-terminal domain-containing protein [Gemmatimonadaceae bacterium]